MPDKPLDLTIRCGLDLAYEAAAPTPMILLIQPVLESKQRIEKQQLTFSPQVAVRGYEDWHGNVGHIFNLQPGRTTIRYDAFVHVPSVSEDHWLIGDAGPVGELPTDILRYTLPSRYCDSDRLMAFAHQHFDGYRHGLPLVQAICDWLHANIEYRFGSGSPLTAASEIIWQRYGVCRDFAHCVVALARCFNIPARYVTGYLGDVGVWDPGTSMDFHAYAEVYVAGRWHTFDARFNEPRIGRIKIACGLDAVDGAFSTLYGPAYLSWFDVWTYQVDPAQVTLGDPIDMSKRLDGTPMLRFPPRYY
jgi:transglutaminase-like putative cysteine protease